MEVADKREPRWWVAGDPSTFGDVGADITWRTPTNAAEAVHRAAAKRQHEHSVKAQLAALELARTLGANYTLDWFAARCATMTRDTLWAVLHGRTRMTLIHATDLGRALLR